MEYSDESYNLHIELDNKNCTLSESEIRQLELGLDPLRKPVEKFPVSNLYVTIEFFERSHEYRVKLALRLSGRGLVTGDVDKVYLAAYDRCVRKMLHKLIAYDDSLSRADEQSKHQKGTHHDVTPARQVDINAVRAAHAEGDYNAFRNSLLMYEESLRKRIGRWIQRYPLLENQLGDRFDLADVVEETYLNAFERFESWSVDVPLGTWLEHLIDPSLKILSRDTVAELENIEFARSLRE